MFKKDNPKFLSTDFAWVEQRILAKLGNKQVDIHKERAERDGITRAQAKIRNFQDIYGISNKGKTS